MTLCIEISFWGSISNTLEAANFFGGLFHRVPQKVDFPWQVDHNALRTTQCTILFMKS